MRHMRLFGMVNPGMRFFLMMACFGVVIATAVAALYVGGSRKATQVFVMVREEQADAGGVAKAMGEAEKKDAQAESEEEETEPVLVTVESIPRSYGLRAIRPFQVRARTDVLENYPCSDCHEGEPANPRERKLTEDHEDIKLEHGGERFWCLTCHGSSDKDSLSSLKGLPISFDRPFILCGQCHFQGQKDWYMGAHGKRTSGWRGERRVMVCPECHDSHSPSIKPFRPNPPPKVRKGLQRRLPPPERHEAIWVKLAGDKEHQ